MYVCCEVLQVIVAAGLGWCSSHIIAECNSKKLLKWVKVSVKVEVVQCTTQRNVMLLRNDLVFVYICMSFIVASKDLAQTSYFLATNRYHMYSVSEKKTVTLSVW